MGVIPTCPGGTWLHASVARMTSLITMSHGARSSKHDAASMLLMCDILKYNKYMCGVTIVPSTLQTMCAPHTCVKCDFFYLNYVVSVKDQLRIQDIGSHFFMILSIWTLDALSTMS